MASTTTQHTPKPRELGLDILRIACMFLIVCQHFMNHGGFLKAAGEYDFFLQLLHVLFAPAVNVFILITGYFSITSSFKPKKLVSLWLQVLFFSVGMTLVAHLFDGGVAGKEWLYAVTPIIHRRYWFFSAYILLYLCTPFLTAMLRHITKRQHLVLIIGITVLAYLEARFPINTVLSLNGGYGLLWFCALFVVGAYLRLYPLRIHKGIVLACYLATVAILLTFRLLPASDGLLYTLLHTTTDYTRPMVLLSAVCLFLLFGGIQSKGAAARAVSYISAATFGVYLLHEAPPFRHLLYFEIFNTPAYHGKPTAVLWVLLFALLTFAAGVAVECLRRLLFAAVGRLYARIRARGTE